MSSVSFSSVSFAFPASGHAIVFVDNELKAGQKTSAALKTLGDTLTRATKAAKFTGKSYSTLDIIAPAGLALDRLTLVGLGKPDEMERLDWVRLGGVAMGAVPATTESVTIVLESPTGNRSAEQAADIYLGAALRAYRFDTYQTKRREGEDEPVATKVALAYNGDKAEFEAAFAVRKAISDGVIMARELVNEPCNVLGPVEFAERTKSLSSLGVDIQILDKKQLEDIGMRALLGVGQGSVRESRVVIMRWNGGPADQKPIAFVGKGVTFDTGGISIKPAQNMEDMKGDMAGAAAVTGLMHTLAARKAKVNVIGAIGLTENMPDGNAQRPGDIVKSLSGQTIEIINTDAEGRLVLADVLWYVQEQFKPAFMVNLATLTGAILVALGQEYAGLFSNNDDLAAKLDQAGKSTGEKLWRMPMSTEFDKMIDSKFADVKNSGGRYGGSTTAAQFLARFVNNTPWAHLDIAGTAMGAPSSDISRTFASGFGVRLLDRLVQDNYEA